MTLGLAAAVGCSTCEQARRTLLEEPAEYSWRKDRNRSLKTYRQWANEVWRTESAACGQRVIAEEYILGFRDGFVDYVYAGGEGNPPPVPPRRFWNVAWRTPEGQAAAGDWFAGYRHGSAAARDGGYRQRALVQSSYRCVDPFAWGPPPSALPASARPMPGGEELSTPIEPMPAPPPGDDAFEGMLPGPPAPGDVDQSGVDQPLNGPDGPARLQGSPEAAARIGKRWQTPVEEPALPLELIEPAAAEAPRSAAGIFRRAVVERSMSPSRSKVEAAAYYDELFPHVRRVRYGAPPSGPSSPADDRAAAPLVAEQGDEPGDSTVRFVR
jgi:hypothetical protein